MSEIEPIPLVIDMDGVICHDGYSGNYSAAPPYQHAIDIINALYDEKDEQGRRLWLIRIQTARYMKRLDGDADAAGMAGYRELKNWLHRHGVKFDEVYFGKASGAMYV